MVETEFRYWKKTVIVVVALCLIIALPSIFRHVLDNYVRAKIDNIKASVSNETPSAAALIIGKWAAEHWTQPDSPSNIFENLRRLPKFARPKWYTIEYFTHQGWCNDLVSYLRWMFNGEDQIRIRQMNIVGPMYGHSVPVVSIQGSDWYYLDPFYGHAYVDPESNQLLDLEKIMEQLHSGKRLDDLNVNLREDADTPLDLSELTGYAVQGDLMELERLIPIDKEVGIFSLGEINGSPDDAYSDAMNHGLTPMFTVFGARYYKELIFRHRFSTKAIPHGAEIKIFFTKPLPDNAVLPRSNITPTIIDNKILSYKLPPEQDYLELDFRPFTDGVYYPIDKYQVIAF